MARRIAAYLLLGALLLAVVTGLASATPSAIIRMVAAPAFGTQLGAIERAGNVTPHDSGMPSLVAVEPDEGPKPLVVFE